MYIYVCFVDHVGQPCRESNDRIVDPDYYEDEIEPTPKYILHTTTTKRPKHRATKITKPKESLSIKPRERKSNKSNSVQYNAVLLYMCGVMVNSLLFGLLSR